MREYDFQKGIEEKIEKEKLARRILGVSEGDGPEKIKKAFWLLAMKYHPDKTPGDKESERRFQNIVNAYDYLVKGERERVVLEDREAEHPIRSEGFLIENAWGYYLWWRDNYFDERYGVQPSRNRNRDRACAFEQLEPKSYEEWYLSSDGKRIDAEEKSSIIRLLGPGHEMRLLDVGCGTGHFAGWFAKQGYKTFGIDTSRRFIHYAKRHSEASFIMADGSDLPFADNAFHTAVAIAVLEFAQFPEYIIREMRRVSDRTLLLLMFNPDSGLNMIRRRRGIGVFASAKFWKPDKAVQLLRDLFPDAVNGTIYNEMHGDFYILILKR